MIIPTYIHGKKHLIDYGKDYDYLKSKYLETNNPKYLRQMELLEDSIVIFNLSHRSNR